MEKLRKLWALRKIRFVTGPFDPRIEVGDEVDIDTIRGVPSGTYIVRSVSIMMSDRLLDMQLGLQAAPDDITGATWAIVPGVDRPTRT